MSAPTIAEQGYELRDAGTKVEIVDIDGYFVAAAFEFTDEGWSIVIFGGVPGLDSVPETYLMAKTKDGAVEWLTFIANQHIKAAAA